jgi:predicted small lipoprotein YifL
LAADLDMVAADEESFVNRFFLRRHLMLGLVPLALAFGLAGCGVKGALEPPPDSGIAANKKLRNPAGATTPVPAGADQRSVWRATRDTTASGTTSRAVVTAPAAEKSSPLDWLID